MNWLAPGEDQVVNTIILDNKSTAKRAAQRWASEKEAKVGVWVWMLWTTGHNLTTAKWGQQQCGSMVINGGLPAVVRAVYAWRSLMPSGG